MALKSKETLNDTYQYWLDDVIVAPAYGQIQHPFTGLIKKIYDASLLIEVTDYDKEDTITITEMNHRAVVRMDAAEIIKKGPKPPEKDEDES
ncbi:MAG: hypothetical protein LBM27_05895 [Lactobacillaceae bacterium]|jgi:hypothetical protein|nr:hypothetical protein [Lactobacillaceae bacterium]